MFQSAPADCRRRENSGTLNGLVSVVSIRSRRLSAGEPAHAGFAGVVGLVSIRSRRLSGGRRSTAQDFQQPADVSIRSRRSWREKAFNSRFRPASGVFQSAPADCRREKADPRLFFFEWGVFQSAPADCRREKGGVMATDDPTGSFQCSRRLSAGGAAEAVRLPPDFRFNPLRRLSAGEGESGLLSPDLSKFQSAPADCRREKGLRAVQAAGGLSRFNPLPPTVGGRSLATSLLNRRVVRFNPLPPTVGGRRPWADETSKWRHVSIRSRRLSAGEGGGSNAAAA